MKKITLLFVAILTIAGNMLLAQVAVNTDGTPPDSSAILDLKSTNGGLLLPRMNTMQISGISNPAAGLLVFNTDSSDFYGFNGSMWIALWNNGDTLDDWYCGRPIIDSRDGQTYETIQIGTQCWMVENLNIGTMITGSGNQTDNDTIEKYCYNNSTTNCDTYGGLYLWDEMMQYVTTEGVQGICPTGWHIPTDAEWCALENEVDAGTVSCIVMGWRGTDAGGNLKDTTTTHWASPNTGATNSSGFTGLPGGYRMGAYSFYNLTSKAHFWSSSVDGPAAWARELDSDDAQVGRFTVGQTRSYSTRCLKD